MRSKKIAKKKQMREKMLKKTKSKRIGKSDPFKEVPVHVT